MKGSDLRFMFYVRIPLVAVLRRLQGGRVEARRLVGGAAARIQATGRWWLCTRGVEVELMRSVTILTTAVDEADRIS